MHVLFYLKKRHQIISHMCKYLLSRPSCVEMSMFARNFTNVAFFIAFTVELR